MKSDKVYQYLSRKKRSKKNKNSSYDSEDEIIHD
jgi:hypothetical protein